MTQDEVYLPGLRDYLLAIRRRWAWVLVVAVALAAATILLFPSPAAPPPTSYSSSAVVHVPAARGDLASNVFAEHPLVIHDRLIESDEIMGSVPLGEEDDVEVGVSTDTRLVTITATSEEPEEATRMVEDVTQAYLEYLDQQLAEEITKQRTSLRQQEEAAEQQLASIRTQIAESEPERLRSLEQERDELYSRLRSIATQQASLPDSSDDVELASVVQEPGPPISKEQVAERSLGRGTVIVLALLLGVFAGLAVALVRDRLDDAVHTEDDLRRRTPWPVLGSVAVDDVARVGGVAATGRAGVAGVNLAAALRGRPMRDPGAGPAVAVVPPDASADDVVEGGALCLASGLATTDADVAVVARDTADGGSFVLLDAFVGTSGNASATTHESKPLHDWRAEYAYVLVVGEPVDTQPGRVLVDMADASVLVLKASRTAMGTIKDADRQLRPFADPFVGTLLVR